MAAGSTYTPIATTTLGTAQSSVSFSSFSGYTDLVLVIQARQTGAYTAQQIVFRWNGDSGTNYSETTLQGTGTSAVSSRDANISFAYLGSCPSGNATAGVFGNLIVNFMNYSNSTTYKTVLARENNALGEALAAVSVYRSNSPITSISIAADTNNFAAGSTFTLWGILNA